MYKVQPFPLVFSGIDLKSDPSALGPGRLRRATNVRPAIEYGLKPRQGTTAVNGTALAQTNVHTARYLNDPVSSATLTWAGSGTKLYNVATQAQLDTGYSGNPLTDVVYRLGGSSLPYDIIGDSSQMRKLLSDGTIQQLGITPESSAATSAVQQSLTNQLCLANLWPGPAGIGIAFSGFSSHTGSGISISTVSRTSGITSVVTSSPHGLIVGMPVQITGVTDTTFDGYFLVDSVSSTTGFTYLQTGANASSSGGAVDIALEVVLNAGATGTVSLIASTGGPTVPLDFSHLLGPITGGVVPSALIDQFLSWISVSSLADVSDIQLLFDVDPNSVSAGALTATAFSKNYYWTSVMQQVSVTGYNAVAATKADFYRVGNSTADWSAVVAVQVKIVAAPAATPTVDLDSLYLTGHGPSIAVGVPYDYRDTNYDSVTLSESNPSPIQSSTVSPVNQPVLLTPAALASQTGVDQKRWWRRGGSLSDTWRLVGTQRNQSPLTVSASPNGALPQPGLSFFTIKFVCTTAHGMTSAGAYVSASGVDNTIYNTNYVVTGIVNSTSFYAQAISSPFGICNDAGSLTNSGSGTISFVFVDTNSDADIASAETINLFNDVPITTVNASGTTVYAQPLAFLWGPFQGNIIFGCGDPYRPGYAYWCNSGNPDGWGSINNVEVAQPSDPLQNGFCWNGGSYVFSKEKLYLLQPTPVGTLLTFLPVDQQTGRGLFFRWGLCASEKSPMVWFVAKDGVYEWGAGGAAQLISNDLWPLFHASTVEGNYPIDFTQETRVRLAFFDGELRFSFQDTNGTMQVWICDILNGHRWRKATYPWAVRDVYAEPETTNLLLYGGADGFVYQESETALSDANGTGTAAISCEIMTPSWNGGDARLEKVYGDIGIDLDAQGATVTVTPYYNYESASLTGVAFSQTGRLTQVVDMNAGAGQLALTMAVDIAWSSSTKTPVVYGWSPSLSIKPENSVLRFTDPEDAGVLGAKLVRGIVIEGDTNNAVRSLQIQADNGPNGQFVNQLATPLSVQHAGQCEIAYGFVPFVGSNLRLTPTDSNPWRLFRWKWLADPWAENAAIYQPWTDMGYAGAKLVQGVVLDADSGGTNVTIKILTDGNVTSEIFTANHNGRQQIAYPLASGDWIPFICHLAQIAPQSGMRIFGARFVWRRLPELATRWRTFSTTHGLPGYQSIFRMEIQHISTADLTLTLTFDFGPAVIMTIPNSGGSFVKSLAFPTPNKFKSVQYEITSTQPARIFLPDAECYVRPWNGDDVVVKPFGGPSDQGAEI